MTANIHSLLSRSPGSPSIMDGARPSSTPPTFTRASFPPYLSVLFIPSFSLCFSPGFDTSPPRPAAFHVDGEFLPFFLRQAFDRGRQPACVSVDASLPRRSRASFLLTSRSAGRAFDLATRLSSRGL